ncbi:hypothetical protein [Botrimarina mediterranea]|uniref:hypothetical protein n=1 Tax=Botrimarina mediterranea TaxID=2528022 RepID=UPI0011895168|nr:hypothetical protein K2D_05980 [Planctomycetes bacterium K2D]
MSIITKLSALEGQRKRRPLVAYGTAVIAAATESDAQAEDIDAVLEAAGKSVAQFEQDVARYHERARLAQQFGERDRWRAEAEAFGEELEKVKAEAEAAARRFDVQKRQLHDQQTAAANKANFGIAAGSFLRRWMPEWLEAEIEPLNKEAIEHRGAVIKFEKRIGELRKGIRELQQRKAAGWKNTADQEHDLRDWSEELDRFERMLPERQNQLEPIEQQLARLRALQTKPWPLPSDLEEE